MSVENRDPWTGEVRRHAKQSAAEVERVLAAADKAFPGWSRLGVARRGAQCAHHEASLCARAQRRVRRLIPRLARASLASSQLLSTNTKPPPLWRGFWVSFGAFFALPVGLLSPAWAE